MFGNHFLECLLWLVCVGSGSEFVSVVNATNDEFFIHLYCEDGVPFFELFVPTIVRVAIGKDELFSHAVATAKDDCAAFPIYARVVALKPVVSEVDVLLAEICNCEVDVFAVVSNRHREFYELRDIPALIAGSISVIDRNGNKRLSRVEFMLLDVHLIDARFWYNHCRSGLSCLA